MDNEKNIGRGEYIEMVFKAINIIGELRGMEKEKAIVFLRSLVDVIGNVKGDVVPNIKQTSPSDVLELSCLMWEMDGRN